MPSHKKEKRPEKQRRGLEEAMKLEPERTSDGSASLVFLHLPTLICRLWGSPGMCRLPWQSGKAGSELLLRTGTWGYYLCDVWAITQPP